MLGLIGRLIGTVVCGFIALVLFGSLTDLIGNEEEKVIWNEGNHNVSYDTTLFVIFLVFALALFGCLKGVASIMPA